MHQHILLQCIWRGCTGQISEHASPLRSAATAKLSRKHELLFCSRDKSDRQSGNTWNSRLCPDSSGLGIERWSPFTSPLPFISWWYLSGNCRRMMALTRGVSGSCTWAYPLGCQMHVRLLSSRKRPSSCPLSTLFFRPFSLTSTAITVLRCYGLSSICCSTWMDACIYA